MPGNYLTWKVPEDGIYRRELCINEGIPVKFIFTDLIPEIKRPLEINMKTKLDDAKFQTIKLPSMEGLIGEAGLKPYSSDPFSYWWYVTNLNYLNMRDNFSSFPLLPAFSEENPVTYVLTYDCMQMRSIPLPINNMIPDWAEARKVKNRMSYDQKFFFREALKYADGEEIPLYRISGAVLEMLHIPIEHRVKEKLYDYLFICAANVGRSQMAEGFYNFYTGGRNSISAAALVDLREKYDNKPHHDIIEVMKELGIDISGQWINVLSPEMIANCWRSIVFYDISTDQPHYNDSFNSYEYRNELFRETSNRKNLSIRDPGSEKDPLHRPKTEWDRYRVARDAINIAVKELVGSNENAYPHNICRLFSLNELK